MRVESDDTSTNCYSWIRDRYGERSNTLSGSVLSRELIRSDVVKNKFDATGWRDPSPYEMDSVQIKPHRGELTYYENRGTSSEVKRYLVGDIGLVSSFRPPPIPDFCPAFPGHLDDLVINKALGRLKDQQIQYAVALAEMAKARDLLASTGLTIFRAIKALKKGDVRDFERALKIKLSPNKRRKFRRTKTNSKAVSSRWLEYSYGWTPLLLDLYGVCEDLERGFLREPRFSVTASVTSEDEDFRTQNSRTRVTCDLSVKSKFEAKIRLDYKINSDFLQTLSQKGITNPLEVAWELTPYSFLVDYLFSIGDWIATFDSTLGLTFRGGTMTHWTETKYVAKCVKSRDGLDLTTTAVGQSSVKRMRRSVYTSTPSGGIVFNRNPFSVKRALNVLALLRQQFK